MKFYYSSMFLHEPFDSIEELAKKIDIRYVELHPDTNICIFLRDFYKEPSSIVKRDEIWSELRGFLKTIETNDLIVDFSLGMEEACRNKSDFAFNNEKFEDMNQSIKALFEMSYFEMFEHSKLIKFEPPVKDATQKSPTKMHSLESISRFQKLLYVNYACLLKMFLLEKNKGEKSNVQLMLEFLDFVEAEIDLFSSAIIIFSYHYFSGNSSIKKLIHKSKNIVEEKVHTIWNASIDLTFPTLISQQFLQSKKVPIFVTSDEKLYFILDAMKVRVMITDGDKSAHPPFIEMDLSKTGWPDDEFSIIANHYDKIMERRKYKFAFSRFNEDTLLDNLRMLCYKLETEFKANIVI